MAFTAYPATGETFTAATLQALISELRPVFARKTADETVNNSAAFQNDNDLALPVVADTVYEFKMRLRISTGTTPDIKFVFTFPAGLTMRYNITTVTIGGSAVLLFDQDQTSTPGVEGTQTSVLFEGLVIVSSTAGTLQLQWAQNTATASDTKVLAGSYMILRKMT